MSPMMDQMLVDEVVPRLCHAARTIPKVGHEDDEEIIQDATLTAARMMDSASGPATRLQPARSRITPPRPPVVAAGVITPGVPTCSHRAARSTARRGTNGCMMILK
jgi:hypothetical protein